MTMLAFRTDGDHAEICTDTLGYSPTGAKLNRCNKVTLLAPHLRGAMMMQGNATQFGASWVRALDVLAHCLDDFDALDEAARECLPRAWHDAGGSDRLSPSTAYHIGYSASAGRFVAVAYPSINGFQPTDASGFFLVPSLLSHDAEPPETLEEWVTLGTQVRAERFGAPIESGHKTIIGGELIHWRLDRDGGAQQRIIHTFDDSDEALRPLVAGTMHPLAQLDACPCGSRKVLAACHGLPVDSPCGCRNGLTWGDCCRPSGDAIAQAQAELDARNTNVGRNDPCPCGSGVKSKRCCKALVVA